MSDNLSSKIFAIIVGIDQYKDEGFPRLSHAVSDAKKLEDFLLQDLQVPESHIKHLYNDEAIKSEIINAIANFPDHPEFEPGHALLFFFSGLAGQAGDDVGMICPVDINTGSQTGLSDSTLVRLFDQICRSYGNNITVLLDCDSDLFHWNDPGSFVVIAPEDATETECGGSFTESLVNVLKLERKNKAIKLLTVESFAAKVQDILAVKSPTAKVQDDNKKYAVKCFGRNTDHFLFDRSSGGAYPAFLRGHAEIGKDIKLDAGLAHGIVPGTKLAIFYSNVKDPQNKKVEHLGEVFVKSADETTSTLRRSSGGGATPLPSIFYAVETYYAAPEVGKAVRVLIEGDPAPGFPEPSDVCGAQKTDKAGDANLTFKFDASGKPTLVWHGPTGDQKFDSQRVSHSIAFAYYPSGEEDDQCFARMFRKATRFAYHLLRMSPADSSGNQSLLLQLQKIGDSETMNTDGEEPKGDHLKTSGVKLEIDEDENAGPFSFVVTNKSKQDFWIHVFFFDASSLMIVPLYPLSPSERQSQLKAGENRSFGSRDGSGLLFECPAKNKVELSYIKVFATKEKTDFSFLEQWFRSPTQDTLRELQVALPAGPSAPPGESIGGLKFGGLASWTTAMFTIVRTSNKN
ncbi:hypothetical protein F5887DRAFT_922119 [Amanita rubescens]|nr:hypothetical protein F5887DRAFT_922119 [Amanita rubescens]